MLNAARPRSRMTGFTVIEVMIVVAIAAILLVLGVPSMRGVLENTRIRAAAESFGNGLAMARNEAVRRNTRVQFCTTLAPGAGVTTGWYVRLASVSACDYATDVAAGVVLHAGSGKEGTTRLAVTVTPNGSDSVTFNSFGSLAANLDASATLTQLDFASQSPGGITGYRPLRLQVRVGGAARVCDPAVGATDPRACL